jgi:hypothetical protein
MAAQLRGTFWVVSTHVLTSGFALPVGGAILVGVLAWMTEIDSTVLLVLSYGVSILAYVGGTFYSLSYLKKVAMHVNPARCVLPSVVTFVTLCGIWYGLQLSGANFLRMPMEAKLFTAVVNGAYYAVVGFVFWIITKNGLPKLSRPVMANGGGGTGGFPVVMEEGGEVKRIQS